ncbi:alpha/beta fold hydrolase [Sneathiella chungangensis]|uniref:Alpha/beta fold hydrolase n=1 Tax=Sneathiella chungangensis TaxID=1418234 RepID=A0A845MC31_9PROT|nr:alpha/beta hydrolase [Sneathiella chungangensis]MZR20757.1 alpha/beta fold hydrolase [Sneathiella chungangensis]
MEDTFASLARLELDGVSLAYDDSGTGAPVVLVHGGASDIRTWSGQVPALSPHFRVISYSRRYARPNAPLLDGADDPIDVHIEDLARLLDRLDASPAHLVGHSWGGLIVLLLALRQPERLRSMTLIEPPVLPLFTDVPPKLSQLLPLLISDPRTAIAILKFGLGVMAPVERAFRRGDDKKAIEIFGKGVLGPEKFAGLSDARYAQVWDNRATDKAQMLGQNFPSLDADAIKRLNIPTLLLAGAESPPLFHRLCEALGDLLPEAELHVLPGASHIVQEDAREEMNARLLDFLSRQAGRG